MVISCNFEMALVPIVIKHDQNPGTYSISEFLYALDGRAKARWILRRWRNHERLGYRRIQTLRRSFKSLDASENMFNRGLRKMAHPDY